jgi:hypothetical protein
MTTTLFESVNYHTCVSQVTWHGIEIKDTEQFNVFLTSDVASRVNDTEGMNALITDISLLTGTGFEFKNFQRILNAAIPEERDWAIGEALAEAFLAREHKIVWPWNTERDKRTPKASLPGADLIGFEIDGEQIRLVLGEVKSSSEEKTPPNVMNGSDGMKKQIENLANDMGLIFQIMKWLHPRCKGSQYEIYFNTAFSLFLTSNNRAVALFGILVRDTTPNELDLESRGKSLAEILETPTTCQLIGLYIPYKIENLPRYLKSEPI